MSSKRCQRSPSDEAGPCHGMASPRDAMAWHARRQSRLPSKRCRRSPSEEAGPCHGMASPRDAMAWHARRQRVFLKMGEKQIHILMFPWLAFGHITPFLDLSRRLADHGLKISFLSTPVNISRIKPLLHSQNCSTEIDLVEMPLPSVEGLPSGAESTSDIPNEISPLLMKALDGLQKPFLHLLQRLSPDCVVYDFAQYWTPTVAAKIGIPAVFFSIFNGAASSYALVPFRAEKEETTPEDLIIQPPNYPPSAIRWLPFEARYILGTFRGSKKEVRVIDRFVISADESHFTVIRSCYQIEKKFIDYLQSAYGKQVLPVGPLVPDLPDSSGDRTRDLSDSYCLRWLDTQAPASVVLVSFGSECFLSEKEIHALALGLEETQLPFLWVLRFPRYSYEKGCEDPQAKASASLPEGFESRTRGRGLVFGGWVPQLKILHHPSTGGFVSHCGWSSVMEAMKFGVKLVVVPMNVDQGLNARLVAEELKIGVEVVRESDGFFSKEEICRAARKAMVEEEGRQVKLRADEMRSNIFDKSECQQQYIENFIKHLRQLVARKCTV
eukprot:Gb_04189 [translate_table: standard]